MGLTGSLSRGFLYGLNRIEVFGLDRFLETLDRRKDIEGREKGLITGMCLEAKLRIENALRRPIFVYGMLCSHNMSAEWMIL